jgi:tetratricopeptide (TPR) repeat protein/predicted Ser/Thr protein kinase
MEDQKSKKKRESPGASGGHGVGVPAKGDSSASNPPFDPGETISDAPVTSPQPPATTGKPTPRAGDQNATLLGSLPATPPPPASPRALSAVHAKQELLQPGGVIGGRYEILQLLGEGGMGAVYKAHDREVERTVALKLIRPELASNPAILARFKQELLTAHQVTHKNVIRIYDLAEADGVKFITMEFVEGSDLRRILIDKGKLEPEKAIEIIRQVCIALDAAHSVGIIHRDLKPQNIMQETKTGRILVMDFGLARSVESEGLTQTGALLGTIEYMSPEQSMGKTLDQRSDIFAVGLIFYELLTGKTPYKADTAMASLLRRNQERAVPAAELDTSIPKGLSDIVSKCLERDLEHRYQNAQQILSDLDAFQGARPTLASIALRVTAPVSATPTTPWKWVSVGALALLLVSGGWIFRGKLFGPTRGSGVADGGAKISAVNGLPALSQGKFIAVLPFRVLGDKSSLGYVSEGLGEAIFTKLFQLKDVRLASASAAAKIDPNTPLPQIAKELGVNLIVHGTVQGTGENLRITVNLENAAENKLVWSQEFAGVTGDLLTLEDQIYARLTDALSTKPSNEEMAAATAHPTENVEAYNLYLKGKNALSGSPDEKTIQAAVNFFNQALQKDSGFALAYTGLADSYLAMYTAKKDKYWSERAVEAAKRAAQLNDKLPEVHASLGSAYAATGQTAQGIAEDKRALELSPNSDEAYRRLGNAYKAAGQKEEALRALEKAVEINPYYWNNLAALGNAYYAFGESDKAAKMFEQVIQIEPEILAGYNNLGAVYLEQGKYEESIPIFQKSLHIQPLADTYTNLATSYFYLKRYSEALPMFEKAVAMSPEDETNMGNLADGYRWAGDKVKAQATYEKAIGLAFKELRVNPRQANVVANLALYYAKKGDISQAKDFIKKARAMDRSNVYLTYIAAVVDTIDNRPGDAVKELTSALEKGYSPRAVEVDPEFGVLQSRSDYQSIMKRYGPKKH